MSEAGPVSGSASRKERVTLRATMSNKVFISGEGLESKARVLVL